MYSTPNDGFVCFVVRRSFSFPLRLMAPSAVGHISTTSLSRFIGMAICDAEPLAAVRLHADAELDLARRLAPGRRVDRHATRHVEGAGGARRRVPARIEPCTEAVLPDCVVVTGPVVVVVARGARAARRVSMSSLRLEARAEGGAAGAERLEDGRRPELRAAAQPRLHEVLLERRAELAVERDAHPAGVGRRRGGGRGHELRRGHALRLALQHELAEALLADEGLRRGRGRRADAEDQGQPEGGDGGPAGELMAHHTGNACRPPGKEVA